MLDFKPSLVNQVSIDRIFASASTLPKYWSEAWLETGFNITHECAEPAWKARTIVRSMGLEQHDDQFQKNLFSKMGGWEDLHRNAFDAAYFAVITLIAYDDCVYLLDSDPDDVKMIGRLGDGRALTMLPACIAFNKFKKTHEHFQSLSFPVDPR